MPDPSPCTHCKGTGVEPDRISHRETFDYIVAYEQFHGLCPSARALADGLGFSTQTAYHRLRDLCDSGLLKGVGQRWVITRVGRDIFALGVYRQPRFTTSDLLAEALDA